MILAVELQKDEHRHRFHNLGMDRNLEKNTPPSPGLFKARSSASDTSEDTNPSSVEEDGRIALDQIKEADKRSRRSEHRGEKIEDHDTSDQERSSDRTIRESDRLAQEQNDNLAGQIEDSGLQMTQQGHLNQKNVEDDSGTSQDAKIVPRIKDKAQNAQSDQHSNDQQKNQGHQNQQNHQHRLNEDDHTKQTSSAKPSIVSAISHPIASVKLVRLDVDSNGIPVAPTEPIHTLFDVDYSPVVESSGYFEKEASPTSPQPHLPRSAHGRPPHALSTESLRRHTAPPPNRDERRSSYDSRRSFELRRSFLLLRPLRQARSTFPQHTQNKPDSTSNEILRMRNSIIVKRSQKKKRFLEDDKVLVGNKISEGHENFVLAYNMLTGIRVAVSRCSGVMQKLQAEDFKSCKKLTFNIDGSEMTPSSKYDFKFKDYCPEVFRELRSLFGLDPADYLVSITGKYILSELGSPGKSGSFFYYSRDFRFIIKTIHHSEHKQLRRILKDYYEHVKENPNTLISQFYGLHRVKMPFSQAGGRSKKVHFVVMNNLFPPHRDVHLKYDLKGSTWGRTTNLAKGADVSQLTLKDLDWLSRKDTIKFGPQKKKLFFDQLESDVKLLKKINVMDYSLLLGIHDVKKGNTFDLSTKLLVFDPKSLEKSELIKTNPRDIDPPNDLPSNVFPGRLQYIFYGHDGGIRATGDQNEPLQEIYYLGIIDCLTHYGIKKRLETFWRTIGHARLTVLAIPLGEYGDRFLAFIKKGTKSKRD